MAVKYSNGGGGYLNYVANNAKIVGMLTGQPWISAIGTGMNALSGGRGYSTPGFQNTNNSPFTWLGNADFLSQGGK